MQEKTEILRMLAAEGEQVLDLEAIACHKGSAFGAIGQPDQPTQEQFENNLFEVFRTLKHEKPVWIENESITIGKLFVPRNLFEQMEKAPMVCINRPFSERLERLVREYGITDHETLTAVFRGLIKRLGSEKCQQAIQRYRKGNMRRLQKLPFIITIRYTHANWIKNSSRSLKHFTQIIISISIFMN